MVKHASVPYTCCRALCATVDHVVPIAQGGPDTSENTVGACGAGNSRKGTQSILGLLMGGR